MPLTSTPVRSTPVSKSPDKTVKVHSPEYVLYTDTELEHVRKQYSDLERIGKERDCKMSKDLRCRLIRNTMTSMISILRATGDGESHMHPSKPEITAMAKRIVQYYPMLKDQDMDKNNAWVGVFNTAHLESIDYMLAILSVTEVCFVSSQVPIYAQLYKRLQNVRSPVRGKSPMRGKSSVKKLRLESSPPEDDFGSSDSTVILDSSSEGTQDSDIVTRGEVSPKKLVPMNH